MKVILTADIDDIGLEGEVKKVKEGLARNYLLPQKLAVKATDLNLKVWEKKLNALSERREKIVTEAREFAEKIEGKTVSIESKVSSVEKIFGSVNAQTISEELKEQHGIEMEKRNILLERNIKSLGKFEVPVRVKANIKATIVVEVRREQENEEETGLKGPPEQAVAEQPENEPEENTAEEISGTELSANGEESAEEEI